MLIANVEEMKKLAKRDFRTPGELSHLLDVKRYPGKRALIRSPRRVLEMMLLASGVKRSDVYAELATRQGQDKAFELLDELAKDVLWVEGPREAMLALDEGGATMAMTYSGRAFRRLIASRLEPIWDGHIIDFASWAVPATTTLRAEAQKFILAATSAQNLAAQARIWPYGPMRRSALRLAKRHSLLDTDLDEFMSTSELRFSQGLMYDAAFWMKHGAKLEDRFAAWQNGVPFGIRVPIPNQAPPPPLPPPPELAPELVPDRAAPSPSQ
jgi:putative spermidine/putrescine transport system substrate-binding protein